MCRGFFRNASSEAPGRLKIYAVEPAQAAKKHSKTRPKKRHHSQPIPQKKRHLSCTFSYIFHHFLTFSMKQPNILVGHGTCSSKPATRKGHYHDHEKLRREGVVFRDGCFAGLHVDPFCWLLYCTKLVTCYYHLLSKNILACCATIVVFVVNVGMRTSAVAGRSLRSRSSSVPWQSRAMGFRRHLFFLKHFSFNVKESSLRAGKLGNYI